MTEPVIWKCDCGHKIGKITGTRLTFILPEGFYIASAPVRFVCGACGAETVWSGGRPVTVLKGENE